MKKLLGIVVLGLLLSTTAISEEILIKCFYDDGNINYIVDTKKKTWMTTSQTKPRKAYIDDKIFLRTWAYSSKKKEMHTDCIGGECTIGYEELDRTTGKYSRLIIETTKAKVKEFNDNNSFKNIDELRLAMKEYIRRNAYGKYILTFYTAECEKTKKAF
tara:strand:+ start:251 stop:727 length:477 start_codon:yes stop_codon:yes gene_type:complete